ncbi:hypothetical protein ACFY9N_05665 [Microbacterium sp. NPDC008134]|uniref:hypothetical protein n=1 Tax=Microbacterium sp. NPDC008134 TaxID=3364183 RepID=UPI0036F146A2
MVEVTRSVPPPVQIAGAFGGVGVPELLPGGRGLTWRVGDVVLRPTGDVVETAWKSGVLSKLGKFSEFSVPRPLMDHEGSWVRDGWHAMEWVPGAPDETRVDDIVRAGLSFQEAIASEPRPSFIEASSDPWSRADRIAWGETAPPSDSFLERLESECVSIAASHQVIHGDLLGNVMFAEGHPPFVIDWAPYWRPSGFGAAIAVVDAACWHGHPVHELSRDFGMEHWRQLLLRALLFRTATLHLLGYWSEDQRRRHAPVAEAIIALRD